MNECLHFRLSKYEDIEINKKVIEIINSLVKISHRTESLFKLNIISNLLIHVLNEQNKELIRILIEEVSNHFNQNKTIKLQYDEIARLKSLLPKLKDKLLKKELEKLLQKIDKL
jgi:hypothetical protein